VNLEGYGPVSISPDYPVSELPSYDSATNTVKDPFLSTVLAWSLSTLANPIFNGHNWGGWSLPGIGTGVGGGGGVETGDEVITGGGGVVELSTGGIDNEETGVMGNGNQIGSTGGNNVNNGGSVSGGHKGGVSSTGASNINNNNNNNNNPGGSRNPNGASILASSIGLVAGLAVATVFAALL